MWLFPLLMSLCSTASLPSSAAQSGSAWGQDYFPNVPLTTHEGRTVHFFDDLIEGKVVAINFIYTSCPDSCPLETARLAEVQRILGERVGRDVFFYSISIDPARDTPEVLAEYARRYDAGPGWLFLTGKARDITLLRKKLGLDLNDILNDPTDHNLSLVIGNQSTGQWKKSSPFENPYVLASELGGWLHNWKLPPEGPDYADAPALRPLGLGEMLFRTRCSACHVIGASDGLVRPGPNLLGVTERRDREWLARWLAAPDEMLADGDPVALELFETFKRVPMPNLRLEPFEIEALLQHLEQENARILAELGDEPELDAPEGEPAPCCQKADFLVLDEAQDELTGSPPEEKASARGPGWRLTLPGWISVGSGVLLGLATLARGQLRRRG